MRTQWTAGAMALLALTSAAWAQGPIGPLPPPAPRLAAQAGTRDGGGDGQAKASPQVLAFLREAGASQLDGAQAARLVELLTRDKSLDPAEYDLLDELVSGKIRAINITSSADPQDRLMLGTQSGAAARAIQAGLERHVEAVLGAPPTAEGWARILRLAEQSEASELCVRRVLISQLRPALEASTLADAYAPVSTTIGNFWKVNGQLPKDRQPAGRWLIWSACRELDVYTGDAKFPDFLYNWTRPEL